MTEVVKYINPILLAFSQIGTFLRAFSDDQIGRLNEAQRSTIGNFLSEHGKRFLDCKTLATPLKGGA